MREMMRDMTLGCVMHLLLLLVKVSIVDFSLMMPHWFPSSLHRFESENRLCRRQQFVPASHNDTITSVISIRAADIHATVLL